MAESSLPLPDARGGSIRRAVRVRKVYRDWVEALLREGRYSNGEIARRVGGECTRRYVAKVAWLIGVTTVPAPRPKPRGEAEIKADLARMLEEVDRRYRLGLLAARLADPI